VLVPRFEEVDPWTQTLREVPSHWNLQNITLAENNEHPTVLFGDKGDGTYEERLIPLGQRRIVAVNVVSGSVVGSKDLMVDPGYEPAAITITIEITS
jgi:hypothetical protein